MPIPRIMSFSSTSASSSSCSSSTSSSCSNCYNNPTDSNVTSVYNPRSPITIVKANHLKSHRATEAKKNPTKDSSSNRHSLHTSYNQTSGGHRGNCSQCEDCPGFISHEWRKLCVACKCSRQAHYKTVKSSPNCSPSLQNSGNDSYGNPGCNFNCEMVLEGYAWSPPGLSAEGAQNWMKQIPEGKAPKVDTDGEKYREFQLTYQLPKQDLALKYCQHVEESNQNSFQDFISARNDIALDIGYAMENLREKAKCFKCKKTVLLGGLAVLAPKFGLATVWHPACFTCTTCDELLVDLTYCVFDDKIYCERHYAENLKPRCGACDELIFSGQYTKALNKDWHCDHFCCWSCEAVLTGQRYVLTDDHSCCIPCYEQNFTQSCQKCEKKIGLDSKDMAYKDLHWHEECFCCQKCKKSLVDKPFAAKNTFIFCGSCYDTEFASRCDACGDTFRPGMKKMEYKSRKWHDKCFQCTMCKVAVGSKPFIIPNDTDVYCVNCFEEKFAAKCTKCKKIMTTGGVTFKNEAWHRECFTCANCNVMLAGQKFASRNDQPYCANCFGDLFAKRCTACTKPITGTGGTRFISFEGRHWHSQCFQCAMCKVSMAGKGFITDGEDIICPDCAKEKLMGGNGSA